MRPNGFATQEVRAEGHKDVEQILGIQVSTITCPTLGKPENHRLKSDFNGFFVRFEGGIQNHCLGNIFKFLGFLTKMNAWFARISYGISLVSKIQHVKLLEQKLLKSQQLEMKKKGRKAKPVGIFPSRGWE